MKIILTIFLVISGNLAFSQRSNTKFLDEQKEADGFINRLAELIPNKEKYVYPEFRDGRIFYVPRRESNVIKLNYNCYRSLISMIDEKGDTMFVANFEIMKYILIEKDLYYHDYKKGYFEILSHTDDSIRLVAQRQLNIRKREVLKDYENPKPISTNKVFTTIYIPRNPTLVRENVTLSRDVIYYLMNGKDETFIANKAVYLKLFPNQKKQIEGYLSQMAKQRTPIKFSKEEDLKKLLDFCLTRL